MCGTLVKISKSIAPLFDYKLPYKTGDVVMYKGVRLVAAYDIPAETVFDQAMWIEQPIQDVIGSGGGGEHVVLAAPYVEGASYSKYSIVDRAGSICQAIVETTSHEWVDSEWRVVRIADVIAENSQKIVAIERILEKVVTEETVDRKVDEAVQGAIPTIMDGVRKNFSVNEEEETLTIFGIAARSGILAKVAGFFRKG